MASGITFKNGIGGKGYVLGRNDIAWMLNNAAKNGKKAGFDELREQTYRIKEISVKQAPVDTGELEAAHKVRIHRNQTDKAHYSIVVEGVINGVDVNEYAHIIHEGLGWWNLGEKSITKQGLNPQYRVGSHFLRRAIEDNKDEVIRSVLNAVRKGMNR